MKNLTLFWILLIIQPFFLNAQNNIDLSSLPEVEDYIVVRSYPSADTIIIGLHGGPTGMLYEGNFEFFEDIPTFSVVEMKQQQHLKPEILANSSLTLEEAIIHNDTTVALLQKVVNHFNDMNKTVVLIGHSFGAFLLPEYLDDYGIDDIYRVIPLSGRLNMNQEVVDAFATGYQAYFIDGIDVEVSADQSPQEDFAGMKLQAGVGYNRYVDSLGMMDLTKLMYVYGTKDEAVGRLLPDEIAMLENTGASIVAAQDGSHDSPFETAQMSQVLDFIRKDQTVRTTESDFVKADVKFFPTIIENNLTVDAEKEGVLMIANNLGQIILKRNIITGIHGVDLSNLPVGQYIATYHTKDNEWANQRLVKLGN